MSARTDRSPSSGDPVRALAVVFPGCAYLEIAQAVARLRGHGEVRFVSADGATIETNDGPRIVPDGTYADARIEGARVVLVPGGELDAVKDDDALSALLGRPSRSPPRSAWPRASRAPSQRRARRRTRAVIACGRGRRSCTA